MSHSITSFSLSSFSLIFIIYSSLSIGLAFAPITYVYAGAAQPPVISSINGVTLNKPSNISIKGSGFGSMVGISFPPITVYGEAVFSDPVTLSLVLPSRRISIGYFIQLKSWSDTQIDAIGYNLLPVDTSQIDNVSIKFTVWSASKTVYITKNSIGSNNNLDPINNNVEPINKNENENVVLLLHGMNSAPNTWSTLVQRYFPNGCPIISYSYDSNDSKKNETTITGKLVKNSQNTYCFIVKFGAFDAASQNKGIGNAWDYGEKNNIPSAGDYSTFDELGIEINKSIKKINDVLPNSKFLLIGHSRGGLAARAYLQNSTLKTRDSVVGLITTGTPHEGTRLGRVYSYINSYLFEADNKTRKKGGKATDDWQVIDFLRGAISCTEITNKNKLDVRRPVIDYLSDNSEMIAKLNSNKSNLPNIKYGTISYTGTSLGIVHTLYGIFDDIGDYCEQVSTRAEGHIKGWVEENKTPIPSDNYIYIGDGIVTVFSQNTLTPTATNLTLDAGVLHTDEPAMIANIYDMTCRLGFSWLESCVMPAQKQQAKAALNSTPIITHDYDALLTLKIEKLLQDWLIVINDDSKTGQRDRVATALGMKLRSSDVPAFYAEIEQRLFNINTTPLERARLFGLLAEIATPAALSVLTQTLLQPGTITTQTALHNAIQSLADSLPENPRRTDLSIVLENMWGTPALDQWQLNTLAIALAKLGTPHGIELLLNTINSSAITLPIENKKASTDTERMAVAAFNAIDKIIVADGKTVLENAFITHQSTEAIFIAAGNGLVNLGDEVAAKLVLQRINELPDNAVQIGQRWLAQLSGKIDKTTLNNIIKATGMPNNPLLRQQMEKLVQ